jgi:hypothetical protein
MLSRATSSRKDFSKLKYTIYDLFMKQLLVKMGKIFAKLLVVHLSCSFKIQTNCIVKEPAFDICIFNLVKSE